MNHTSPASTYFPSGKNIVRESYIIDAAGQRLGRLATQASSLLMGKDRPDYTPFLDLGAHVIIINADQVRLTGKKSVQKTYRRYTGYPGGLRAEAYEDVHRGRPERVVRWAIEGMLPKTRLSDKMEKRLHVYAGDIHPHPHLSKLAPRC